jgi:hypothetical protein
MTRDPLSKVPGLQGWQLPPLGKEMPSPICRRWMARCRSIAARPRFASCAPEPVDVVTAPLVEPLTVGVHATELCACLRGATVLWRLRRSGRSRPDGAGAKEDLRSDVIPERLAGKEFGAEGVVRADQERRRR